MRDDILTPLPPDLVEKRLAARLLALRNAHSLSLEALADRAGISRATLSRIERAETSPTAAMLGRLCAEYGWTLSRLLAEAEVEPARLVRRDQQVTWTDPETQFVRRAVSPPTAGLRLELVEGTLLPGAEITYLEPPVPFLEHHVWMLQGRLHIEVEGTPYLLNIGDCLRFRLSGALSLMCPEGGPSCRYLIALSQS